MSTADDDAPMSLDELALRTALNCLRDSLEFRRMPSGLRLEPDALAMHEQAARHLELMLHQVQAKEAR